MSRLAMAKSVKEPFPAVQVKAPPSADPPANPRSPLFKSVGAHVEISEDDPGNLEGPNEAMYMSQPSKVGGGYALPILEVQGDHH